MCKLSKQTLGEYRVVMSSIGNFSTKLSVAVLSVLVSASCVFANTLSEIQINSEDSGYGIVLKTDDVAQIKKTISADNRMTIELKDVEISSDLNTVYNDVSDIDNVTVSPLAKNGVKIVLKGKNVTNSRVSFEKSLTPISAISSTQQSIELSAPMNSYTPVYTPEMFVEETVVAQTSNPQLNEILTKMNISRETLLTVKQYAKKAINKAKSSDINMITLMGLFLIGATLLLRPSKKQQIRKTQEVPQTLSGILSQSQRTPQMEREINLNKNMLASMDIKKPANLANPTVNSGYGMRAYQQSQKNPYASNVQANNGVSGIARRNSLPTVSPIKKQTMVNKPISVKTETALKTKAPSVSNPILKKQPEKVVSTPQADMDSMKFLESITKIYEKSGRADLAKGLQDNLKKAQMSQNVAV